MLGCSPREETRSPVEEPFRRKECSDWSKIIKRAPQGLLSPVLFSFARKESAMKQKAKGGRMKRWHWLLLVAAVLIVAIGVGISVDCLVNRSSVRDLSDTEESVLYTLDEEQRAPEESDVPVGNRVGQLAPEFTLAELSGGEVALSDFRNRVVVLDFWATWCSPCRASMPGLEALRTRYRDKGLVVVSVSLDRSGEDARSYLERNGYEEFIGLWESLAAAKQVARLYGVFGIPRTFVIDRNGFIRYSGHPARLTDATIEPWL